MGNAHPINLTYLDPKYSGLSLKQTTLQAPGEMTLLTQVKATNKQIVISDWGPITITTFDELAAKRST